MKYGLHRWRAPKWLPGPTTISILKSKREETPALSPILAQALCAMPFPFLHSPSPPEIRVFTSEQIEHLTEVRNSINETIRQQADALILYRFQNLTKSYILSSHKTYLPSFEKTWEKLVEDVVELFDLRDMNGDGEKEEFQVEVEMVLKWWIEAFKKVVDRELAEELHLPASKRLRGDIEVGDKEIQEVYVGNEYIEMQDDGEKMEGLEMEKDKSTYTHSERISGKHSTFEIPFRIKR